MSISKELRERFTEPEKAPLIQETLGILGDDIQDIIVSDIGAMIDKGYRSALEGYILCLSRILEHSRAWKYISRAFLEKNEKIPSKYYQLFGKDVSTPSTS